MGSFFYKRKLTLYNLTVMTLSKQGYCAIWMECISRRAGNDIASAFIQIIKKVAMDHTDVCELICWSDSCVPQNRNSHISQALPEFLDSQDQIKKITMKYSLAGHSCVQEVDNMYQQIEVAMRVAEFYSPVSFLQLILKINQKNPFRVIQMSKDDFKDYQNSSKMLKFCNMPYTQVFQLRFSKSELYTIKYKLSHGDAEFQRTSIEKQDQVEEVKVPTLILLNWWKLKKQVKILVSRKQKSEKQMSKTKADDFKSMLKLMPSIDQQY